MAGNISNLTYQVPDVLSGKTFQQLGDSSQIPESLRAKFPNGFGLPGADWYGNNPVRGLQYGYDQPLRAGEFLQFKTDDPTFSGSGEYRGLQNLLGAPLTQSQIADIEAKKALTARQQAIAPAVSSLEASIPEQSQKFGTERSRLQGEVDPIKQRYQTVLDELKRRESRDTGEVNTALAREFGRRGIPLSSGLYEETGIEKRRPVSEFYGIQGREASASQEENLRNITNLINQLTPQETEANRTIRNAIAQLQSGAGNASIEDAFNQLRFQEEQRQYQQNYTLQQAQQAATEKLQAAQIANYNKPETKTNDISKNFASLGEGQTLFNLLTGKPVYSNPKTYKPTGSGTGDGWEYV